MLNKPPGHYYGRGVLSVDRFTWVAATELSEMANVTPEELSINLGFFELRRMQTRICPSHQHPRTFYLRSQILSLCPNEAEILDLVRGGEWVKLSPGTLEFTGAAHLLSKSRRKSKMPDNLIWLPCSGVWAAPRMVASDLWLLASAKQLPLAIRRFPVLAAQLSKRGPA